VGERSPTAYAFETRHRLIAIQGNVEPTGEIICSLLMRTATSSARPWLLEVFGGS
jgi:hypothetical protein